jgi:hypothetical protein
MNLHPNYGYFIFSRLFYLLDDEANNDGTKSAALAFTGRL